MQGAKAFLLAKSAFLLYLSGRQASRQEGTKISSRVSRSANTNYDVHCTASQVELMFPSTTKKVKCLNIICKY